MNVLLVEPDYRSKFPPLGLLKISSFHKSRGDNVSFVRGKKDSYRKQIFDRIYISSLFTYELPRTLKTIKYYEKAVINPKKDIIVGGVGATLLPNYILQNSECKVIQGSLDKPNLLELGESPISKLIPDYNLLSNCETKYSPDNAYFTRVTIGCIRKCKFCAVPKLEPDFGYLQNISEQISEVNKRYGERKDLIVLDNNILAIDNIKIILNEIKNLGFYRNSKFHGKKRCVDFNQGIDARLITKGVAQQLGELCLSPVRLAFDHISVKKAYLNALDLLIDNGFKYFTTYVMFNFNDTPESFYNRLRINLDVSDNKKVRITGFPMKYAPIDSVNRHYISKNWNWRFLRGIQCILNATHGMVSPNPVFFNHAFGNNYSEFIETISMPDDYIIYRQKNESQAFEWKKHFRKLSEEEKTDLFNHLEFNHKKGEKEKHINKRINKILEFYYSNP